MPKVPPRPPQPRQSVLRAVRPVGSGFALSAELLGRRLSWIDVPLTSPRREARHAA